ncbi:MAG: polyphosphate kinase 2 family protein [Chloroflexota bacterium]|nr:polyphosphate kinase 2 family protein [Chloroflexota bacterium]
MQRYRVRPDTKIDLSQWDPNDRGAFGGDKREAREKLRTLNERLEELQELLYAEHKHKVLIVLQAMDTGGKDGTIRHVFEGVNPQGVKVAGFKVPTPEELDHDYLWRIHKRSPARGTIVIFNRSHYEDVLAVRVHNLAPPAVWGRRYAHINSFERMLSDEGTTILKFFLHIDLDEQKKRFQARLDEPRKRWKFRLGDVKERKLWPEYMRAYEDVLGKTSTEWAPWYIVPANRKWYRNLVVATVLVETLGGLNMSYPQPEEDLDNVVIE